MTGDRPDLLVSRAWEIVEAVANGDAPHAEARELLNRAAEVARLPLPYPSEQRWIR